MTSPPVHPDPDQPDISRQAEPLVGVIYNRNSHQNRGMDHAGQGGPNVLVAAPGESGDLPTVLAAFAERGIDLLVINGGDGTVRDVLTSGLPLWGDNWPALAVLPKGKTNALNVDLGAPNDWTLEQALSAFAAGRRTVRRPMAITQLDGDAPPLLGFILGAGALTTGIKVGQAAHRLGAFNSLAVGVTTGWGVLQALFGTDANAWRRGVAMTLKLGAERRELPYRGNGDPARRGLLFSSTLERLPVGMKPFGPYKTGLRLVVLDSMRRGLLALMPAIVAGYVPDWVLRAGLHFAQCDSYEMHLGDDFILDGEAFSGGTFHVGQGPELHFVTP